MMFCKRNPDVCLFYIDNKLAFGVDNTELVIFDNFDINIIALELYNNYKEIARCKVFCGLEIFKSSQNELLINWNGTIPKIFWELHDAFERVKGLDIYV